MRSFFNVLPACGFLVLAGALPLFVTGCLHRTGCRECGTGSARLATVDPQLNGTADICRPSPTANAGTAATRQTTCPVTGEKLGSMGPPIPVSVKGETIYVCCQGCVDAVRTEPAKYLAIVRSRSGG